MSLHYSLCLSCKEAAVRGMQLLKPQRHSCDYPMSCSCNVKHLHDNGSSPPLNAEHARELMQQEALERFMSDTQKAKMHPPKQEPKQEQQQEQEHQEQAVQVADDEQDDLSFVEARLYVLAATAKRLPQHSHDYRDLHKRINALLVKWRRLRWEQSRCGLD